MACQSWSAKKKKRRAEKSGSEQEKLGDESHVQEEVSMLKRLLSWSKAKAEVCFKF